ncbi:STELLO glycosyltransferase [anaerobic digester metagenome]
MGKNAIVITTIFPPTEAIRRFSRFNDFDLVVVGDKKTPRDWELNRCQYLSIADQENLKYDLIKNLPFDHYCRKMVGYLYAISQGAEAIVDTDDDNIPKNTWAFPDFDSNYRMTRQDLGFINTYNFFTDQFIWPRGFPLQRIRSESGQAPEIDLELRYTRVGVWQGLADGDPDVDAIYRLTDNTPCFFRSAPPVVLGRGTISPFNSQNTMVRRELFPLLYLPAFVTFRFTDILRGLVAQPIMWAKGYTLGFTEATVVQERNEHDYLKDFESEIPCYLNSETVIEIVASVVDPEATVSDNLLLGYQALYKDKIVAAEEVDLLKHWLSDLSELSDLYHWVQEA